MNDQFTIFIESITPIIKAIESIGGISYLVGGSIRDLVLKKELKDFDIEVHNLELELLEQALKKFGNVILIGKKFGVLRIVNYNIDWSLPRKDNIGRKPIVTIDSTMTIKEACRRRDLTMNAMALNLNDFLKNSSSLSIIDPYNGLNDINQKQLRAVDEKLFLEDPLRFYRVMQFIGRFDMMPDEKLNRLCQTIHLYDTKTDTSLSCERIYEEIKKLFLKSLYPSNGFRWLASINRLDETFPELQILIHHRTTDINFFEKTMNFFDTAAQINLYTQSKKLNNADEEKFLIMLASLCYFFEKIDQNIKSINKKIYQKNTIRTLLNRLTNNKTLIKSVIKLIKFQSEPNILLKKNSKISAYKKIAAKITPELNLHQLGLFFFVTQEQNKLNIELFNQFIDTAKKATVLEGPEQPVLLGRHLIDTIKPGPLIGTLLQKAYHIQINENIQDWKILKQRVLSIPY